MKKKLAFVIIVFGIGVVLVLLVPHLFSRMKNNDLKLITYEEMEKKIEDGEKFFLIISKEGCPDCENLKKAFTDVEKNTQSLYMFEYSNDRSEKLIQNLESIFPEFVMVPYICYVNSGQIVAYENSLDVNDINEWIQEMD